MKVHPAQLAIGLGVAVAVSAACGGDPASPPDASGPPPTARLDTHRMLLRDLETPRHSSDGGGRAWLESGSTPAAGGSGSWEIVYEAGPEGVAVGGRVMLQVSPFWGWSTPQTDRPGAAGYTEVTTGAAGVELAPRVLAEQLLGVEIGGRALAAGERVRFRYGAGEAGARADRFAERRSIFWIAVDGDGDGVRALVPDRPATAVLPGPAARLALALPATARPGEPLRLTVAALDVAGNGWAAGAGVVELEGGLEAPASIRLDGGGLARVELEAAPPGVYRLRGRAAGLAGRSHPVVVSDGPRLLWGDLHGHSDLSDGTATPEDYFRYARDVAALDVVSLTDHDHWGMVPLAGSPEMWGEIVAAVERFHRPGRFVTLEGFEWTNWVHGHRHVLWFEEGGEVLDSLDPRFDDPAELWAALAGREALTFAHHSAGGPVATDWSFRPPPELEPVTEISSVHGSSEALDSPGAIYSPVPGNFVRDVLDSGLRLGFVGSGDSHDGHPGLAAAVTGQGGLAGIWAEEATREAVLEALRARRTYATNGPRIYLRTELDGRPMGATLPAAAAGTGPLAATIAAVEPVERVDLVRSGRVVESVAGAGRLDLELALPLAPLESGEYLYLRVVQTDGGVAWSSPYFLE